MTSGKSINDPWRSLPEWQQGAGTRPTPFDPGAEGRESMTRGAASGPFRKAERSAFTVRDAMTRNAHWCRPDDRLAAAAMTMCEGDCRFLPVVDGMGHPVGVITDGDICLLGSTDRRSLREIFVREAMSGQPATCRADDDLLAAIKILRERRIRHLPVVNAEGLLEGVLSLTDLVLCAEEQGSSRLREEVAAALRSIVQKDGNYRVILYNPFIED
ncbi:MAG: CBS domain-containing protein [Isosphaeraceae bacterium]